MKIFEIPDKNGKITYRVQTPDGVWHNTDKEGNFLPEEEDAPREKDDSSHSSSPLKKRRGGEDSRTPSDSKKPASMTLHFTREDYEEELFYSKTDT